MSKILFVAMLLFVGCSKQTDTQRKPKHDTSLRHDASSGWYEILIVDRCEYIVFHGSSTPIIHKANCKNHRTNQ